MRKNLTYRVRHPDKPVYGSLQRGPGGRMVLAEDDGTRHDVPRKWAARTLKEAASPAFELPKSVVLHRVGAPWQHQEEYLDKQPWQKSPRQVARCCRRIPWFRKGMNMVEVVCPKCGRYLIWVWANEPFDPALSYWNSRIDDPLPNPPAADNR